MFQVIDVTSFFRMATVLVNSMFSPNYTSTNGVMTDEVSLGPTASVTPRGTFAPNLYDIYFVDLKRPLYVGQYIAGLLDPLIRGSINSTLSNLIQSYVYVQVESFLFIRKLSCS